MSVRIGVDFRAALAQPCGIARYAVELSRGLLSLRENTELVLYAASRFGASSAQIPRAIREHPRAEVIQWRFPARALKALSLLPGFDLRRLIGPVALLHHTDLTYLPLNGVPEVVTIHDLAYEISPDYHESDFRRTVGIRVRRAVDRARAIIVPSLTTRRDLVELYGVDPTRISVIPHGADHVLRRVEDTDSSESGKTRPVFDSLARPYLLHVGTVEPRKNLPRLLRAFRVVASRNPDIELVLAGSPGWKMEEFDRELRDSPFRNRIRVLNAVSEESLRELYRGAQMLVYPSLYEGYGLPVVEAMALGTPVVTSDRSSTAEIAGDAALLVDPDDEEEIAGAIESILADEALQRSLSARGAERARKLTWRHTAQATFEVYKSVLRGLPVPTTAAPVEPAPTR